MTNQIDSTLNDSSAEALVIQRVFDAPVVDVWKAWTDPERFMRWWGPADYTCPACKIDLRVGGKYLACMRSPEGQDMWSGGVYRQIDAPQRLVFTDHFADANGNLVPDEQFGMGGVWPVELLVILTFTETEDRKTLFTLRHEGIPPGDGRDATAAGWEQSFDKLAKSLRG